MPPRIAIVGSSNIDLVTAAPRMPAPGETLAATSFATGPGGKGANQAVAAAINGAEVLFVTRVGDDHFGAGLLERYRALGIDTRHARAVPGHATGTATILVEPSGENRILIAAGANAALTPEAFDEAAADIARCDLLVLQLEVPLATVYRAIAHANKADVPVLLNPAPAHPDLDPAQAARATFLVPNQGELALLNGQPTGSRAEVEAAARDLVARGARNVIVTLGADGALIVGAEAIRHVPAPRVDTRDTTGAGDAFIGAFVAHWVASRDLVAAVERAVRFAADTTTRPGAQTSYADSAIVPHGEQREQQFDT